MNTSFANKFGKVVVLMGGISVEREVSLNSGAAVLNALKSRGINAHGVDAQPENIGTLQDQGYDRAFIILHGRWGEDGVVQGALEAIGMPYTGSGVLGCALAMDKVRSKQIWQSVGLPSAEYRVLRSETDLDNLIADIGLPLFMKPACEGSSVGVAKVTEARNLLAAYKKAAKLDDVVLAEKFISGDELTVAILNGEALPIVRMQTENEFYDYQAKYESNQTQYFCPSGLSSKQETEIQEIALKAFKALGCDSWGRVDVMLDENNKPLLLEVNPAPGMTDHSLVPIAAAAKGISFEQLVLTILEASL